MLAAVMHAPSQLTAEEVARPQIGPGEILLKVGANTICGTDLRIFRGEKTSDITNPTILGHEIAGHIEEVGADVADWEVGALVGVHPIVTCGRCTYCERGMENACLDQQAFGYALGGGFAEYVRVPARAVARGNLIAADRDLPAEQLALAEPLSCVVNGHRLSAIRLDDVVAIMGTGPIGLLHLQLARLAGAATVIVSEPNAGRRAQAERLGADVTVEPDGFGDAVGEATGGLGADSTIICIGVPALVNQALEATRFGGRVNIFAGLGGEGWAEVAANLIHYRELVLTGTSGSTRADYRTAVRLISSGRVNAAAMVTHRVALADAAEALDLVASGEGLKVAVVP